MGIFERASRSPSVSNAVHTLHLRPLAEGSNYSIFPNLYHILSIQKIARIKEEELFNEQVVHNSSELITYTLPE